MLPEEVLERLAQMPSDFAIFACGEFASLTLVSPTLVLSPIRSEEMTLSLADGTYRYLLEVGLAREAIEVYARWSGLSTISPTDHRRAIVHYAVYDAFFPADGER